MSFWSSWANRNVVLEQLGRPERRERPRWFRKDPKALKPTPDRKKTLLGRARKRPLLCRECPFGTGKLILRRRAGSKCRPGAVEMSSWSSWTGRNVVLEQQDTSKCRPGAAGQIEMSSWSSRTGRNVVLEQLGRPERRERPQWFRKDSKA